MRHSGHSRRRNSGPNRSRRWSVAALIVGVPVSFLTAVMVLLQANSPNAKLGRDLCPVDGIQRVGHTVILIDQSDVIEQGYFAYLEELIQDIKFKLNRGEKLSIYTISDSVNRLPTRIFALCSPGGGDTVNPLISTPAKARQVFRQKFQQPLKAMVRQLDPAKNSSKSPIMEALTFLQGTIDFQLQAGPRRLIIFSDMLQNSTYSHYRTDVSFRKFRNSKQSRALIADLTGVEVEIHYVLRTTRNRVQGVGHIDFWRQYFGQSGVDPKIAVAQRGETRPSIAQNVSE